MTAHDPVHLRPEQAPPIHLIAAGRLVRPLASLALMTVIAAAAIFGLYRFDTTWLATYAPPGFAGIATGSLLLAGLGLVACFGMVLTRRRHSAPSSKTSTRVVRGGLRITLILLFSGAAAYAVIRDWPSSQSAMDSLMGPNGFTIASVLLLLATPWLLADHYLATIASARLPEIDDLRSLVFLPVIFLAAEAILQVVAGAGFGTFLWVRIGLDATLLLVCAELALRVLGSLFLPPRDIDQARAMVTSLLASTIRGRVLSPGGVAGIVRSQFGMDFSRSWALRFMRSAALPVGVLMLAFCWFLTGVTRIDMNERGAYERFGNVATLLRPGLHLVLPAPFGRVRHTEFGVIHSALIGIDMQGTAQMPVDTSTAEGDAPETANRLWDSEQSTDASYIIASGEQGQQSFQTVSAGVRVLYRVGLDDAAAKAVLYRIADPDALVHAVSGRLLARFFASRTLPVVLGENQGVIAGDLRGQLQQALDGLGSGIDVVAVTIEAIHPPAGAASAYRNVQAAEIEATTEIATEQGRAKTTSSVAQLNARSATDAATAAAAETVSAAQVDLIDITADDRPYRAASKPFLLERYYSDLQAVLANAPLEIIDHRLTGASLPTIDLRPPGMLRDSPAQGEKLP
ncbi:MAG TPA: SPFH domain-containing protein [Rhodopila sp.]|nr:SPFH domain-containing protein [Rhodopila sp.]